MTDSQLLIGSLSNDLFRVATLIPRVSDKAVARFLSEAKRWVEPLAQSGEKAYIRNIAQDVIKLSERDLDLSMAERCLMQAVLLQNYSLIRK